MNDTTLIVGAGPTGLTAAIELRRFGLPVRLIDKSDHAARWSQALAVQARTLEQFQRYGIAAEAVFRGRIVRYAHLHQDSQSLARIEVAAHIPGRFPFVLCLPQNDTEDILTRHAQSLGVEIERGVELTGLSNTAAGDGVEAHLTHADGRKENPAFRFLLGCDGAHSATRRLTGTPFEGRSVSQRFSLGDLELVGEELPGEDLSMYLHQGGLALFVLLLPSGLYRVITIFPSEAQAEGEQESGMPRTPTLEDFNEDFRRFGLRWEAKRADWLSPFRVNERKAKHYRQGNVFLLGDAAHIHSPAGGQGMNTGIQDAANLAWKLAAVLGGAPDALLESYSEEREAVARAVLRGSSIGLRIAGSANPVVETLRNFALKHVTHSDSVLDAVGRTISEVGIEYRKSPAVMDDAPSGPLHAGDRMPDPGLPSGGTLLTPLQIEPLQHAQHLLIAIDVPGAAVPRDLKNTVLIELHGASLLEDELGKGPLLYLVRPDGYIGFRGTADNEALRRYAASVGLL